MSSPTLLLDAPALEAALDRVDLWVIALEPEASLGRPDSPDSFDSLDPGERAFAARLRMGAGTWSAVRAALRRVLGCYLGLAPANVALESGSNGKPRLALGAGSDLRFNHSHSGDVALIAVRLGHEVGVDVEAIRPGVDGAAIAREIFDAFERDALAGHDSDESFFRAWARHEALAKATGRGIADGPEPGDRSRFKVLDVEGIPGCAAALASEGNGWSVRRV
jgi:4'-phosphopantetheinyl transferase